MTDAQYDAKFQEMQKYVPFIQKVIEKLKVNNDQQGDNPRKAQLQKMEMLHGLLTNQAKKLKMETLLKCEGVIIKLHAKIEKSDESLPKSTAKPASSEKTSTPKQMPTSTAAALSSSKQTSTSSSKQTPTLASTSSQANKLKTADNISVASAPASPSPERIVIDDDDIQPVVIPTERRFSREDYEKSTNSSGKSKEHKSRSHDHHHHRNKSHAKDSPHYDEQRKDTDMRDRNLKNSTKHRTDRNPSPIHHRSSKEAHRNSPVDRNSPHSHVLSVTKALHTPTPISKQQHAAASHKKNNSTVVPLPSKPSSSPQIKVVITEPLPSRHFPPYHQYRYQQQPQNSPPFRDPRCLHNITLSGLANPPPPPAVDPEEAYNPDESWEKYNEAQQNSKQKSVFNRLGEKIIEPPPPAPPMVASPTKSAPISIPARTTALPEVLKSPPLTATDINKLLSESAGESISTDISEIGSRRPKKPTENAESINPLDFARKKLSQIARIDSPQHGGSTSPSVERTNVAASPNNERLALKYNPHPRQERLQSLSSNDGSESSHQSTSRNPSDPRLKLKPPTPVQQSPTVSKPLLPMGVNVLPSINAQDPRLKRQTSYNQPMSLPPAQLDTANISMAIPVIGAAVSNFATRIDPRLAKQFSQHTAVAVQQPPARRMSVSQPYIAPEPHWDVNAEDRRSYDARVARDMERLMSSSSASTNIDQRPTQNMPITNRPPPPMRRKSMCLTREQPTNSIYTPDPPKQNVEENWDSDAETDGQRTKSTTNSSFNTLNRSDPRITKGNAMQMHSTSFEMPTGEAMPPLRRKSISQANHERRDNWNTNRDNSAPNSNMARNSNFAFGDNTTKPSTYAANSHGPSTSYPRPTQFGPGNVGPAANRFNSALNDSRERMKYFESKKQKHQEPRTYREFKEAKEKAQALEAANRKAMEEAQAAANRKLEEAKTAVEADKNKEAKTTSTEQDQDNKTKNKTSADKLSHNQTKDAKEAMAGESTLDKMYRTQNFNTQFPKATLSFKIPKKKTEEDNKKSENNNKIIDKTAEVETFDKVKSQEKPLDTKSSKPNKDKNAAGQKTLTNITTPLVKKSIKPNPPKASDSEENWDSDPDDSMCLVIDEKPLDDDSLAEANVDNSATHDESQTQKADESPIEVVITGKAKGKNKTKQQSQKAATPEQEKNNTQIADESKITLTKSKDTKVKTTKPPNQPTLETDTKSTNNIRDPRCRPKDKQAEESSVAEKETLKLQETPIENKAQTKTPKFFDDLKISSALSAISREFQPQRIMRRRCTMLSFGSEPLVDKNKLLQANANMLEDIEEREKRRRKQEEEERQTARRNKHLADMFQKTDDNCTVSTQNIITGKRRTRTSINFNETQNAMKVFKHLTKKETLDQKETAAPASASAANKNNKSKGKQKACDVGELNASNAEEPDEKETEENDEIKTEKLNASKAKVVPKKLKKTSKDAAIENIETEDEENKTEKEDEPKLKAGPKKLKKTTKASIGNVETEDEEIKTEKEDTPKLKVGPKKLKKTTKASIGNVETEDEEIKTEKEDTPKLKVGPKKLKKTTEASIENVETEDEENTTEKEDEPKLKALTKKLKKTSKALIENVETEDEGNTTEKEDTLKLKAMPKKLKKTPKALKESVETEEEGNSTEKEDEPKLKALTKKLKKTSKALIENVETEDEGNTTEKEDTLKLKVGPKKLKKTTKASIGNVETEDEEITTEKEDTPKLKVGPKKPKKTTESSIENVETEDEENTTEKEDAPKLKVGPKKPKKTTESSIENVETEDEENTTEKEDAPKLKVGPKKLKKNTEASIENVETEDEENSTEKEDAPKLKAVPKKLKKTPKALKESVETEEEGNSTEKEDEPKLKALTKKLKKTSKALIENVETEDEGNTTEKEDTLKLKVGPKKLKKTTKASIGNVETEDEEIKTEKEETPKLKVGPKKPKKTTEASIENVETEDEENTTEKEDAAKLKGGPKKLKKAPKDVVIENLDTEDEGNKTDSEDVPKLKAGGNKFKKPAGAPAKKLTKPKDNEVKTSKALKTEPVSIEIPATAKATTTTAAAAASTATEDEHQNCAVSSTSMELTNEEKPTTSAAVARRLLKEEVDDNEPSSTGRKSSSSTPTPADDENSRHAFLNEVVQEIIKPNADKQHILSLLSQILSEDKLEIIKTVIDASSQETTQQQNQTEDTPASKAKVNKTKNVMAATKNKTRKAAAVAAKKIKNEAISSNDDDDGEEEEQQQQPDKVNSEDEAQDNASGNKTKTSPNVAMATRRRNELDRLNDDIRDMFICEGVLTATGKRMCTLMNETKQKKEVESLTNKRVTRSLSPGAKPTLDTSVKRKVGRPKKLQPTKQPLRRSLRSCKTADSSLEEDDDDDEEDDVEDDDESVIDAKLDDSDTTLGSDATPRKKMPVLKPNTPIRLPEELEEKRDPKAANIKRKQTSSKPCPKSKKKKTANAKRSGSESDHANSGESEAESTKMQKAGDSTLDTLKNTNIHWHNQSKYTTWCMLCTKKIVAISSSFHYKMHHGESYISRLAPVLVQKFKQGKLSRPLFGVDKTPKRSSWFHKCPFCLQHFNTPMPLWLEHFQNHTAEFHYECSKCHWGSNRLATTKRHLATNSKCKSASVVNSVVQIEVPAIIRAHVCHLCNFLQLKRANLERHYIEQHQLDGKNVDLFGYTITLFDHSDVKCVTEAEAMVKEEEMRKLVATEEQVIDLDDSDNSGEMTSDNVNASHHQAEVNITEANENVVVSNEMDSVIPSEQSEVHATESNKSLAVAKPSETVTTKPNVGEKPENVQASINKEAVSVKAKKQATSMVNKSKQQGKKASIPEKEEKNSQTALTSEQEESKNSQKADETKTTQQKSPIEEVPTVSVQEKKQPTIALNKTKQQNQKDAIPEQEASKAQIAEKTKDKTLSKSPITEVETTDAQDEIPLKQLAKEIDNKTMKSQSSNASKTTTITKPEINLKAEETMVINAAINSPTSSPKITTEKSSSQTMATEKTLSNTNDSEKTLSTTKEFYQTFAHAMDIEKTEETLHQETVEVFLANSNEISEIHLLEQDQDPLRIATPDISQAKLSSKSTNKDKLGKETSQLKIASVTSLADDKPLVAVDLTNNKSKKKITKSMRYHIVTKEETAQELQDELLSLAAQAAESEEMSNEKQNKDIQDELINLAAQAAKEPQLGESSSKSAAKPKLMETQETLQKSSVQNLLESQEILEKSTAETLEKSASKTLQKSPTETLEKPTTEQLQQSPTETLQKSTAEASRKMSDLISNSVDMFFQRNKRKSTDLADASVKKPCHVAPPLAPISNAFIPSRLSANSSPIQIIARSIVTIDDTPPQTIASPIQSSGGGGGNTNMSMAERLSQRFKVLQEKATASPEPESHASEIRNVFDNTNSIIDAAKDSTSSNSLVDPAEHSEKSPQNDEVTVISDDEAWEDIEITESAPNAGSSHMQKSKNKGLFQKFGLFKRTTSKTKKHMPPLVFMSKKKSKEKSGQQQQTNSACSSPVNPRSDKTSISSDKASISSSDSPGFKPAINIMMEDLLPDSPCNDPIDLVPELTPLEPLTDLNDISSILDSNLSVSLHMDDESHTCIQDALDFISEQAAQEQQTQNSIAPTKSHTNKVQNVGYSLQKDGSIKFYCLLENCSFLFSSEAMGLENHFLCEHSHIKWNGYCLSCQSQCFSQDQEYSISKEIKHMVEHHANRPTLEGNTDSSHSAGSSAVADERPRIKLRRMTGDCLSTGNSDSAAASSLSLTPQSAPIQSAGAAAPSTCLLGAMLNAKPMPPTKEMPPQPEMPLTEPLLMNSPVHPSAFTSLSNDFVITAVASGSNAGSTLKAQHEAESALQISSVRSLNENQSQSLPKISNVCTLSAKTGQLWAQQLEQERQELLDSAAASLEVSHILANAQTARGRSNAYAASQRSRDDSPGPVITAETLPAGQAKAGEFVITQTVSAQYGENTAASVGFNISIEASTLSNLGLPNDPPNSSAAQLNRTEPPRMDSLAMIVSDLLNDDTESFGSEETSNPITSRLYKCMANNCKYTSRVNVSMSAHLRFHEQRNLSVKRDYFDCAFCSYHAEDVDDYMKHSDQYHIINKGNKTITSTAETENVGASTSASSRNICDILSKKMETTAQRHAAAAAEFQKSLEAKQKASEEDYLKKLRATIEEIVGSTGLPDDKLYRCVVKNCRTQLTETTFHNHILYHISTLGVSNPNNYTFKCPHCPAKYNRPAGIKAHIKVHTRNRYFCFLCEETAASALQMQKHFKNKHWDTMSMCFKVLLKPKVVTNANGTEETIDSSYLLAYANEVTEADVRKYGEKLILEWQRKKSGSKTHFKSSEIELLPIQPIFQREVNCGECEYKTKVRTNMYRHLLMHKQASQLPNNAGQTLLASVDPVNPVPCLNSSERFFDKMTNLASSSLVPQTSSSATANSATNNVSFKLNQTFVPQASRLKCGVPSCTFVSAAEDAFRAHLTGHHNNAALFRCPFCQEDICKRSPLTIPPILNHIRFHGNTLYRCEECNYVHHLRYVIERHINEKHSTMKVNIMRHERTEANVEGTVSAINFIGKKYKKDGTDPNQTSSQFTASSSIATTATSSDANVKASSSATSNANSKSKGKWICDICKYKASSLAQIQSHCQSLHGQNKPYQCLHCPFGSQQLSQILHHVDEIHPDKTRKARYIYHKVENTEEVPDEADTRPLWQRNDPTRVRHIRGILMEDEEESEKYRKKLGLDKANEDDYEEDETTTVDTTQNFLRGYEFGCFHCEYKSQRFDELIAVHHKNMHDAAVETSKPFMYRLLRRVCCPECLKFTGNFHKLQLHLMNVHNARNFYAVDISMAENEDTSQRLQCAYCSCHFLKAEQLLKHFQSPRIQHFPHDVRIENHTQVLDILNLGSKQAYFQCTICTEIFGSKVAIVHHAVNNHADDEGFSFKELTNTLIYSCPLCTFFNAAETEILRHMTDHYGGFKRCNFCPAKQTSFEGYMQHCYAEHREEIHRFRDLFPYNDIRKFLSQMLVIFPNGLVLSKKNLLKTKFGSELAVEEHYEEMHRTAQQPPIPRLSIARLVARKSIEAQHKQKSGSSSPQYLGTIQEDVAKKPLQPKKITKRRCTVAIGQDEHPGHNLTAAASKLNKLANEFSRGNVAKRKSSTAIVEQEISLCSNQSMEFNVPLAIQPMKIKKRRCTVATDHNEKALPFAAHQSFMVEHGMSRNKKSRIDSSFMNPAPSNLYTKQAPLELEYYSYYGIKPEPLDLSKIYTKIAIGGINTPLTIDKFRLLFNIDCQLKLTKCDDSNVPTYTQYKHIQKACPASHKLRFN